MKPTGNYDYLVIITPVENSQSYTLVCKKKCYFLHVTRIIIYCAAENKIYVPVFITTETGYHYENGLYLYGNPNIDFKYDQK